MNIKILHLEDSLFDSELIHDLIESGGIRHDYFLADNEKDYLNILENENIDIILSDFSLPDYSGNDALKVAREKYAKIPFIFISGTIGEDAAIHAMLNGATDYVLKNKTERLVPAIIRALHENKLEHERKIAVKAMEVSETRYRRLFETAKDGILILDAKTGKIMDVNPYLIEMLGYSKEQFIKKTIWEIGLFKDIIANQEHFVTLQQNEYIRYDDLPLETADGRKINVEFVSNVYNVHHHKVIQCNIRNITDRKKEEKRQILMANILSVLNRQNDWQQLIKDILSEIKKFTGFEAIGIRLKQEEDYPYFETAGFPANFIEMEMSLCSSDPKGKIKCDSKGKPFLECMCGNIISGRIDPGLTFFTAGGSFWSNNTTELPATTMEEDRQARTRNRCNVEGYESVALIPIHSGDEIIGLLQFNDKRTNRFTLDLINFFEKVGSTIGIAFKKMLAEKEIKDLAKFPEQNESPVFRISNEGILLYANPASKKIIKEIPTVIGDRINEKWMTIFGNIYDSGKKQEIEIELDGRIFLFIVAPIIESGYFNIYATDITENKKAEKALLESEKDLHEAQHIAQIGSWKWNLTTDIITWSEELYKINGHDRNLPVPPFAEMASFYTAKSWKELTDAIENAFLIVEPYELELEMVRPDGTKIHTLTTGMVDLNSKGNIVQISGTVQDITQRRLLEEKLMESERTYRHLFEYALFGIGIATLDGKILDANNMMSVITGSSIEELKKINLADTYVNPNDRKILLKTLKTHGNVVDHPALLKRKDGTEYHASLTIGYVNFNGKNVLQALVKDVTKSKHDEEALQESEKKYRSYIENAPDGVFITDDNGRFIEINKAGCSILGYTENEIINLTIRDVLADESLTSGLNHLKKIMDTGKAMSDLWHINKDGSRRCLTINAVKLSERRILGFCKDITQEKQFDKRIINAIIDSEEEQRKIFAQELHDGLGPMFPAVKLFLKSMKGTDDKGNTDRLINKVNDIMDESNIIIKELSQKLSPHVLVNHGLNSALNDYFNKIEGKGIHIEYESNLRERLSSIIETALYRVIMELINNSIKYADAKQIKISICKTENVLHVRYSDKGCGFDVTSMLQSNKGNGLFNIINRMKALGAEYRFISSYGKGFSFYANINL